MTFGQSSDGILPFEGWIDEVHISNIARTRDWIITEYNNQFSPSAFFTIGPENGGSFTKAHSSTFLVF